MFSVVIPLYNKELSIQNTVNSVLQQTFQDFEIVIVNDGATDNSLEIVKAIQDSRIRIINQENQGVSAARNRGIQEAKFNWIAFLDGDDLWKENHLETIVELMKTYPEDKFFSTSFLRDDEEFTKGDSTVLEIRNFHSAWLKEQYIWTSVVVLHKDIFQSVKMFNTQYAIGEDIELWNRISQHFRMIKSQRNTAIYRLGAENRSDHKKCDIRKTFLYNLDFSSMTEVDKRFYRFWIIKKSKEFITGRDYKCLLYVIFKYGRYFLYK